MRPSANSHPVPPTSAGSQSKPSPAFSTSTMNSPFNRWLSLPRVHFLTPENARPVSAATVSILASKLLIALWLLLDTPTRLPAAISAQMTCALVCVLPVRTEEHTTELQSLLRISYAVFCVKK